MGCPVSPTSVPGTAYVSTGDHVCEHRRSRMRVRRSRRLARPGAALSLCARAAGWRPGSLVGAYA
eukprot:2346089-Rhodomonas_salina.1